jgi:hypothetical protein
MADSPHPLADSADPTSQGGVSFSEEQRESFRALAASMSFVGVCSILFGVLLGLLAAGALYSGFTTNGLTVLAVVVLGVSVGYIPAGWWAMAGGRSLSALVSTRGRDVAHLMASVKQLRALFGFARAVIIVQALVIAAVAGVLVWCTLVVDKGTKCVVPWG